MTDKLAQLSGTVHTSSSSTTPPEYVVVLFPSDRSLWSAYSRFIRVARPNQSGRFTVSDLMPASYLAIALEYIEAGEEADPEFLERIAPLGTPVRLEGGQNTTLALKLSAQ